MISLLVIFILSYLLGSIPTSIIVGRLVKGIDVRDYGSGNAGGTNAFRVLGWKAGICVSLFDVFKGYLATVVISGVRLDTIAFDNMSLLQILAGVCAILGHTFTVFAGFRGGKGVGTAAGMLIGLYPVSFILCAAVFALVIFSTGIVSIGSMSAAISLPIILVVINNVSSVNVDSTLMYFSIIIPLFIIFTHRTNISRLINGEEKRFNKIALFRGKKN